MVLRLNGGASADPTNFLAIALYPGISIYGQVGRSYRVEYTNSLGSTNWSVLTNVTLPKSPFLIFDPTSTGNPTRFYRSVGN